MCMEFEGGVLLCNKADYEDTALPNPKGKSPLDGDHCLAKQEGEVEQFELVTKDDVVIVMSQIYEDDNYPPPI